MDFLKLASSSSEAISSSGLLVLSCFLQLARSSSVGESTDSVFNRADGSGTGLAWGVVRCFTASLSSPFMLALFAAANDFMVGAEVLGEEELILSVKEDSYLMIVTRDGKMIRIDPGEIRQVGRSTQGVRLVRMEENDQVAAA